MFTRTKKYLNRNAINKTREQLLFMTDRQLEDMGFSRDLLKKGADYWPWRKIEINQPDKMSTIEINRAISDLSQMTGKDLWDVGISRGSITHAIDNGVDRTAAHANHTRMKYYTRRFVRPSDLNTSGHLFGGQLLSWIDEEAAIFASCQMARQKVVTKYISEIDFQASSQTGDILEFGLEVVKAGRTSLTTRCEVRNKNSLAVVISIERLVFVAIDDTGKPTTHGYAPKSRETVLKAV